MSILDEYRRNAEECQRMAEKAGNAADRASWLRLAASWLGMIKSEPRRFFATRNEDELDGESAGAPFWHSRSEKDSQTTQ